MNHMPRIQFATWITAITSVFAVPVLQAHSAPGGQSSEEAPREEAAPASQESPRRDLAQATSDIQHRLDESVKELDALRKRIVEETLPADADALYLIGGYPELHAPRLAANAAMRAAIRAFCSASAASSSSVFRFFAAASSAAFFSSAAFCFLSASAFSSAALVCN